MATFVEPQLLVSRFNFRNFVLKIYCNIWTNWQQLAITIYNLIYTILWGWYVNILHSLCRHRGFLSSRAANPSSGCWQICALDRPLPGLYSCHTLIWWMAQMMLTDAFWEHIFHPWRLHNCFPVFCQRLSSLSLNFNMWICGWNGHSSRVFWKLMSNAALWILKIYFHKIVTSSNLIDKS